MATTSEATSRERQDPKNIFYKTEDGDAIPYIILGNYHGVKNPDNDQTVRRETSCFLLPDPGVDQLSFYSIDNACYENACISEFRFRAFWYVLDDLHKERRLLLDYMGLTRDFSEERTLRGFRLGNDRLGLIRMRSALEEMATEVVSVYRRLFIEEQHKGGTGGFPGVISRMVAANIEYDSVEMEKMFFQWFNRSITSIFNRMRNVGWSRQDTERRMAMVAYRCNMFNRCIFKSFVMMYGICLLEKGVDARKWYMRKLRSAEVHWRDEHRSILLEAVETKGASRKGSYLERLIKKVGMEKFKVIAFGKERFCSACGRSSHTGPGRLLCCKRCVDERKRPKARYCNVECQKADWLKHKLDIHSPNKVTEFEKSEEEQSEEAARI